MCKAGLLQKRMQILPKNIRIKTQQIYIFYLFNNGSINCRGFLKFEESDGCLYENINYKYQYEKQTSENKIEFEYGDSDNSNIKNCLKQNIKFWSETLKADKAIVNVLKEGKKRLILDLCYVNKHIYKERIKFVDLKVTEQFLNPHEYMCT